MPLDRPIPAFYCCYLLRSTVRHGSVYVGSTPNPVRRLGQHNGLAKGGAVRTSRDSLRPWEMTAIVTGFPSHVAALQFEWAWQNPHITQHIPTESRIQHATQKKRSGHPKRPRHTVSSLLSNLHLLLRVPSFARWPLQVRFFNEDVYKCWSKWCQTVKEPVPEYFNIIQDFKRKGVADSGSESESSNPERKRRKIGTVNGGIERLEVGYADSKSHIEKGKNITDFELEGQCAICKQDLDHEAGIYTICSSTGCESVTHITCLATHFLKGEEEEAIVPVKGNCPSCKAELRWVDVVKESTLRLRGWKEIEKLLKSKKGRKLKRGTPSETVIASDEDEDEYSDRGLDDEMHKLRELDCGNQGLHIGDSWNTVNDSEESDTNSIISTASASQPKKGTSNKVIRANGGGLEVVIEDSDWDDAEVID